MSRNRQPVSPHDQAVLDNLKALGLDIDPATGKPSVVEGGAFQGLLPEARGPVIIDSPEVVTVVPTSQDPEPLVEEFPELSSSPEVVEEPVQEPKEEQLKGEAKREHDAREAQRQMSKTQLKLDKTVSEINRRQAELDEKLQKLSALQATTGIFPTDLNPADAETVKQYREEYGEAVSVMEAIVAPAFNAIAQVREQLNGIVQQWGEQTSRQKEEAVLGAVYSKIPKERVAQITESDEFIGWLSDKPQSKRNLYVDILNNTSRYSSEEALDIFSEFSKDSGIELGLGGKHHPAAKHQAPMDKAPTLRTGNSLPPVTPHAQPIANDPNRPLTLDELSNFSELLSSARGEQKDILLKRLNATNINIDGNAYAQTLM